MRRSTQPPLALVFVLLLAVLFVLFADILAITAVADPLPANPDQGSHRIGAFDADDARNKRTIIRPCNLFVGHRKLFDVDVSKPFTALSPSVDLDVLVVLGGSTVPRSGREIARRSGRSKTGVQHVLDRLVDHGLVYRLDAGNTSLYTLNQDHLLTPAVELMINIHTELIRRLREQIATWKRPPTHASLFGSAARGDGDHTSDIDLLIVRPLLVDAEDEAWRTQIDDLADLALRWSGNNAGIVEVSEGELPRLRSDQPAVIAEVQQDAIDLAGEPARRLLSTLSAM